MKRSFILSKGAWALAIVLCTIIGVLPAFSQSENTQQQTGKSPQIVFAETEHDFGTMGQQETAKHTFTFKNAGDATLIINDVKATCGCTGTLLSKKELAPGEEGNIEVTFSSGASGGEKKKSIFVHSNDPKMPSTELHISAKVVVPLEVRPRTLYWVAEKNMASMRTIQIFYQPDLKLKIENLHTTAPAFTASARPKADAEFPGYDIDIKYDGSLPVGNFIERLIVETNQPNHKRLEVALRGKVVGAVKAVPDSVSLGVIEHDVVPTRSIRIYSTDTSNFELTKVEASNPLISYKISREGTLNRYQVTVSLTSKPPKGAFSGKLLVETNDREQKLLEIPVYAYVK
ncbi:MAG: DUF1573 domain-containing protein [Candidatus Abyssobacteria bacterium SURF_17]|jgi:hypothetical protein|uniref:DUF1573 domain-containing protein n=1 Tax=Candidatus Abyssobacteria bacterium SURF_17 TaxID=2093361 RepID=A0A419ERH0_9BACT|nr:MAG: DUF1573 domain-containing protein [Candidatus Abyssubacteria bacterium SURF_17]